MSTLAVKDLVMKGNAGSCLGPSACHQVTTDAYYKKAGQVRTLIIQDFEKSLRITTSSLVQLLQV